MRNGKILLIEHSFLMRAQIKEVLSKNYGAEIIELETGDQVYGYLNSCDVEEINLIILSNHLSDVNDMEIAEVLRQSDRLRSIPIIIISSRISKEGVLHALKLGVKDVLVKPINSKDLLNRINSVLYSSHEKKATYPIGKTTAKNLIRTVRIEIKRANRGNYPVSFILLGLIENDFVESGITSSDYQSSSEIPSRFFTRLHDVCRETDLLISLSPREYSIILPFTDEYGTECVKEKIRHAAHQMGIAPYSVIMNALTCAGDDSTAEEVLKNLNKKFKRINAQRALDKMFT